MCLQSDAPELLPEESTAYPAKKKKRRSRGGAKRTARKHAARLATEQVEIPQVDGLATEELQEELAQETIGVTMPDEVAADASAPVEPQRSFVGDSPATDPMEPSMMLPPTVRKRGTGPTPKKSTVITKSGLVKRGKRNDLYRTSPIAEQENAAKQPDDAAAVDSTVIEYAPASAPIISPPIIPIALLERPAVSEAMLAAPVEEVRSYFACQYGTNSG